MATPQGKRKLEQFLTALMAELPPAVRDAVEGRIVDEREYADLAASLRCSEGISAYGMTSLGWTIARSRPASCAATA